MHSARGVRQRESDQMSRLSTHPCLLAISLQGPRKHQEQPLLIRGLTLSGLVTLRSHMASKQVS